VKGINRLFPVADSRNFLPEGLGQFSSRSRVKKIQYERGKSVYVAKIIVKGIRLKRNTIYQKRIETGGFKIQCPWSYHYSL